MADRSFDEIAKRAQVTLSAIVPGVRCVPQEWDGRIDCFIKMPDGSLAGEMILVERLSEEQLSAVADRLKRRASGDATPLINEIRRPARISVDDTPLD